MNKTFQWNTHDAITFSCDGLGLGWKEVQATTATNKYNHSRELSISVEATSDLEKCVDITVTQAACPWIILGYGQLDLGKLI